MDLADDVLTLLRGFSDKFGDVGRAVEDAATIGRPAGEGLEVGFGLEDVAQFVAVGIIEDEVGTIVHHFNLLRVFHVEHLPRLVGGEHHPVAVGMPGGIDGRRKDGVAFHVQFSRFSVLDENRAAVLGADVEEHPLGGVVLIVVTVDAVVVIL